MTRLVGSSAITIAGLQASAIAISTRWHMPPESWCGLVVHPARRGRDTDIVQQPDRTLPSHLPGSF
jgi:hypothetical protein